MENNFSGQPKKLAGKKSMNGDSLMEAVTVKTQSVGAETGLEWWGSKCENATPTPHQ